MEQIKIHAVCTDRGLLLTQVVCCIGYPQLTAKKLYLIKHIMAPECFVFLIIE